MQYNAKVNILGLEEEGIEEKRMNKDKGKKKNKKTPTRP